MGIGDEWGTAQELLHPRGRDGKFRKKWKMAAGVIDAILKALGGFNPRTFGSNAEAGQYLFNHAKPSRFRGGSEHKMLVGFEQANKNLRAGSIDADTKKFVKVMDESSINLPEDLILSRIMTPEMFGLTTETANAMDGPDLRMEGLTGTLVADRGYFAANIGTPLTKQPGQIELRVAVPKGTKAVIPGTSRNDREVILDHDQETRITKITPDGQGGFYIMAVARPRTPGETPEPVGAPAAAAPGAPQAQVPGNVQSDNAPDPRAMAPTPGAPPPRVEPEVTPAIGGAPDQPQVQRADGVPGVESAPGVVPEAPPTPRLVDIRAAVREANTPVPSRGKRRADWNSAYMALGNAKNPKDPVDVLRELDRDIEHWKGSLANSTATGNAGDDPELPGDIEALEQLRDVIREQYDIPGPRREKKAPQTQKQRNAEIRKETRSRPTPEPDVAQLRRQEEAVTKARVTDERRQAEDEATNAKIQQLMAPILEKARVNESDLGDLDRTGFLTVGSLLQKRRITRVEAARRLRTDRDSPLNKIADALDAPRAKKAAPAAKMTPAKKAAPEAPAKPLTAAEARIQAALDAAKAKPITGTEGNSYRMIVKGLEDGDLTPAQAAKQARDSAKYFRKQASTVGNFSRPNESGRDVERRKAAIDRVNALADRYDKLADDIKASQTPPAKKAAPAKAAAPEAPAAPGDDLDKMLKVELVNEARKVGVTNASSMTKPQLKDAIREGRGKPATLAVRVPEVEDARALPVVPKTRVQDGDIAVWQAPGESPMVGRFVDIGPRKPKYIDWNGGRRERISPTRPGPHVTFYREGAAPAPAKKAAPPVSAAPTPAAPAAPPLKIGPGVSSVNIKLGDKIWVGEDEDGWGPTKKKSGSLQLTVGQVERVMYKGKRGYRFSGVDQDGNRRVTRPTHGQNTYQRVEGGGATTPAAPAPDAVAPASFPDNDGAPVDMGRALRRNERNEMADVIDALLVDGENVDGFDDKLGGRGSVKDNLETMRDELRGSGKMTPGDVSLITSSIFHRLGLGRTTSGFHDDQERFDIELRNLLSSRIPAITAIPAGPRTPAGKAARSKVDGPKVDAPVAVPDRKKSFRDAVTDMELNLGTDSVGRQTNEIFDEIEAGRLTPEEGIRRLETEISMNKEEIADLDRAIREEPIQELKRLGVERRKRFADSVGEQERASAELRKFFAKEPATTPDAVVIELPQEMRDSLDKATIQDLKQAAKISGLREPKGRTKKAVLDDIVKQMTAKELESRGLTEKVAPPKAADKPKPTPAGAKYERIDIRALAEGLPIDTKREARMFDRFQELLDGEKESPAKVAKEIDATASQAFFWPAVVNQQVSHKTIYPEMDAAEVARLEKRNIEVRAETDRLQAKGEAWKELAERVRKIRRKSAGSAPSPAPEPKLTAPEKAEIKKVAELVDIPAPTLAKKALAKKQADAPPSAMAQQVAQTLETVSDREAVDKILKGRTKPELLEIAKAMDVPVRSSDTKAKISDQISAVVGGKIEHGALVRGTDSRLTRADLEQMPLGELVELEDELGIKRTSLLRSDRIDAILAKGGGSAPAAPDLEEAARVRQADIDQARRIGNAAGEWDQILDAGASAQAMVARLRAAEAREGIDLRRIIESVEAGNMQQARIRMQTLVDQAGLIKRGNAGKIQQYHAASDQLLPGQTIGPSGRVRVIRPGYSLKRDGKTILLSRPVVEPVDEPEAPSAPVAPKMSDKPIIENTWGGLRSPVRFHEDGVIGLGLSGLGENKKLEVDGDALQNVLGKLATELVDGKITGDQLVTRLRALAAKLPEGRAKNSVARMADEIDAPKRGSINIPDRGEATSTLQQLMNDLLNIPLARGGSKADRRGEFNEVDELLKITEEYDPKRPMFRLTESLRQRLINHRHESMEGKEAIDAAIQRAIAELDRIKKKPS